MVARVPARVALLDEVAHRERVRRDHACVEGGDDRIEHDGGLALLAISLDECDEGRLGRVVLSERVEQPLERGLEGAKVLGRRDLHLDVVQPTDQFSIGDVGRKGELALEDGERVEDGLLDEQVRGRGREVDRLVHEVRARVRGGERVAESADHAREPLHDARQLGAVDEQPVTAQDGELDVESRHELADRGDLVEPILGRLLALLGDLGRRVSGRQLLARRLTLVEHTLVYKLSEGVEDLGDHCEDGREKGGEGGVAEHLAHLDGDLERSNTLLAVPRGAQLLVQAVDTLYEFALRHIYGASLLDGGSRLDLFEPAARLVVEHDLLLARRSRLVDVRAQLRGVAALGVENVLVHTHGACRRVLLEDHRPTVAPGATRMLLEGWRGDHGVAAARRNDGHVKL